MNFSIVVVTKNNKNDLSKTLESIFKQTYRNYSIIVIDGNSNDGTKEYLSRLKRYSYNFTYVSEPDKGIYDAMNKGIDLASGEYLIFLNSGDTFADQYILKNTYKYINDEGIYFGRVIIEDEYNRYIGLYPTEAINYFNIKKWLIKSLPNHQSMFFPKSFYKNNKYNLEYKISADSYFKISALKKYKYFFIPTAISIFKLGGISNALKMKNKIQIAIERINRMNQIKAGFDFIKTIAKAIIFQIIFSVFGKRNRVIIYKIKEKFEKIFY